MNEEFATEAENPSTQASRLAQLARSPDPELCRLVAQNPNAPVEALLLLSKHFPREVTTNPSFALHLLERPELLRTLEQDTAFALALCEDVPDEVTSMLLTHPAKGMAYLISHRRSLSAELLWALSCQAGTLQKIIEHPNCPKALWSELIAKGALNVARARELPPHAQALIAQSADPQVQLAMRLREEAPIQAPLPRLRYEGATDVGAKRQHNEDVFGLYHGESLALFVVVDGMAGQSCGEIAARATCDLFVERARSADNTLFNTQELLHYTCLDSYTEIGKAAVKASYSSLHYQGRYLSLYMGAAMVALIVQGHTATIAHVGDSRIYLLRDEKLSLLTEDHSLLNHYIKAVKPTPKEIEDFPHKNVIMRSLGMSPDTIPDIARHQIQPGDRFILCSDGLTNSLSDETIRQVAGDSSLSLSDKTKRLIQLSNEAGGADNITVILLETTDRLREKS